VAGRTRRHEAVSESVPDRGRADPTGSRLPSDASLGLYLHIPFCASICHYCNFNRGLLDQDLKRRYVDAIETEIRRSPFAGRGADTVFFGGGTPSLLSPDEVDRLVRACRDAFDLAAGAEVTIEANPETVSPQSLDGYRRAGVNRLSYGVQSFRDDELARLGRLHSAETARRAVTLAREAGFDNLSLDLMLWLPGQRIGSWLESVDALIDVSPEHASLYLLEIYPNAPLRDVMARGDWSVAPDDDAAEMYLEGLARLDGAGFGQYEISNVARPGRQSRHNLKYWQEGSWLGFGCGAHSTADGIRWRNRSATSEYIDSVTDGRSAAVDVRTLPADERLEEALFMGLRLARGVALDGIRRRHSVDVWARFGGELAPFVEAGLLVHEPGRRLALTRRGMLLGNEIMAVFIGRVVR
jgi:oxygen-independent coproporphyrinogen-3 oxidase